MPLRHLLVVAQCSGNPRRAFPPEVSHLGRTEAISSRTDQDGTPHADPESLVFQGSFEIAEKEDADRSTVTASWDLKPGPCNLSD
jgi:hypothetical protein